MTVASGTEILVSTRNAVTQANPQITTLANGGFAVTWASQGASSNWEVRCRVFAADGTPVNDSEFLVSPSIPYNFPPQIIALADGGFAVTDGVFGRVFAADGTLVNGSDFQAGTISALANGGFAATLNAYGQGGSLTIRVYAADGTPVNGSDFLISTTTNATVSATQITALADGGFAVTWVSNAQIRGQVFAADGTPVNGSDFMVSTSNGMQIALPQVTALADGGFAVTWMDGFSDSNIRARVFAADGTPVNGSDFLVSTTNAYYEMRPQITALTDGGFVVTWGSFDTKQTSVGVEITGGGVRGRVFAADGTPVNGSDFLVSTANTYNPNDPVLHGAQITALADGGFAVTWQSFNGDYDIRSRLFAADGTPVNGSDFLVPTANAGDQNDPQITALPDGGFAVTWQSFNGLDYDIHARVFSANEVPAVTAPAGLATDEDTALVINGFTVDDPDGSQLTVTLTAASTLTLSQIDGLAFTDGDGTADQKMTFSGAIVDINAALAGMTYTPTVDFNGTGGFDYTLDDGLDQISGSVAINVDAVNDAPTIISNGAGAAASVSVAENSTAVTTVTATDPDIGQTRSYSIIGGADASNFTIGSTTGALSFVTAPNFELPTDTGGNNVYDVTVQVSDGHGGTDSQAIAVTVTNANDVPTITSNGGGAIASVSVAENTTAVTTVSATDPDAGTALSYSVVGGADQARFQINATTGALAFITAPNFEAPTDANANNGYEVQVRASDGHLFDDQTLTVNVTDEPENLANLGDVLWRHNDGRVATADHNLPDVPTNWRISTSGDFDGDGDTDIMWRHVDGLVVTWEMENGQYLTNHNIEFASVGWEIVDAGDFDADGDDDILWRHRDGAVVSWEMENGAYIQNHNIEFASVGWEINGMGDFDADGDDDIIWRHRDGLVVTWEMENNDYVVNNNIEFASTGWQIRGTGDFDADGDDDILWRHNEGMAVAWQMEAGDYRTNRNIGSLEPAWRFQGSEDFDSDGDDDILWRHDDGSVLTWEMDGGQFLQPHSYGVVSNMWQIVRTGEFDLI